ncbi:MAG: DUF885 family protein [Lysobacterales bacterium]
MRAAAQGRGLDLDRREILLRERGHRSQQRKECDTTYKAHRADYSGEMGCQFNHISRRDEQVESARWQRRGAENCISRLQQFPRKLDDVLEGVKQREREGIVPPTFVVEKVLTEMRGFVDAPPIKNVLYTSFDEKLGKLDSATMGLAQRSQILARASAAIQGSVYPAYQRMIAYYEELLPKIKGNHGPPTTTHCSVIASSSAEN